MRILGAILCGCLVLMVWAGFVQAVEEKEALPAIEVEQPTFDFDHVPQGEIVEHDFRVFNRGSASLEIKNVKPG